jgi:hypothetical protein
VSTCYLCNKLLSASNRTVEHILLNALGGRLTSNDLICRNCNSEAGNTDDSYLVNQLVLFAFLLDVKRDSGKHRDLSFKNLSNGKKVKLSTTGTVTLLQQEPYLEMMGDQLIKVQISAPNKRIAIRHFENIKNKHRMTVDENTTMDFKPIHVEDGTQYVFEENSIGGPAIQRSSLRSVVSYYLFKGGERARIQHLLPLIKEESSEINYTVRFYYSKDAPYQLRQDQISHSITVAGLPEQRILFGHIEYFNILSYMVLLNDQYSGLEFRSSYVYDLLSSTELAIIPDFPQTRDDILEICWGPGNAYEYKQGLESRLDKFKEKLDCLHNSNRIQDNFRLVGFGGE